jgi:hypothetical protein
VLGELVAVATSERIVSRPMKKVWGLSVRLPLGIRRKA